MRYLRSATRLLQIVFFWMPIGFFSLLLIYNTIPYFSFSSDFSFIKERFLLFGSPVYRVAFYSHIAAGAFCIFTALLQFSSYLLRRRSGIHRWSGRVYVFVVLAIGGPTGLYMSFFAKGSVYERGLFMFMAVLWIVATYQGLAAILKRNVVAHKIWMIRSYAMALTAVTFRLYHIIFYLMDWDHLANYEISLWISVFGNIAIAEWLIWKMSRNYLKTFTA